MKRNGHISNDYFLNKGGIDATDQNSTLWAIEKTDTIKKK